MTVKITADWVLDHDGTAHRLIQKGEVIVSGGRIEAVSPQGHRPSATIVALGRALLMPGFIDTNALADADTTILGLSGSAPGAKLWSDIYARAPRDVLTVNQMVAAARATFAQLLLSGVTTALPVTSLLFRRWAESTAEFAALADLSDELGLRLVLGPSFRSAVNTVGAQGHPGQLIDEEAGRAGLDGALRFIRGLGGRSLLSGLLVPSTIETCSDDLLRRTADAASDLGVPFRLHCCQSEAEVSMIWTRSGRTPIAHLAALGALSDRALLPHAKHLGGPNSDPALIEADHHLLADSGATVVHCPLVYARGGQRVAGLGDMLRLGINVGMGTDTTPPNMLMNLQAGMAMARIDGRQAAGPRQFVEAATLGGATAIGRPDLGRIAPGAAADLVAWDLSRLEMQPVHDPIEALFVMPPGQRPAHVWVAGRHVVRDGQLPGFDEVAAGRHLQAVFDRLVASFPERHAQGLDAATLFPRPIPLAERASAAQ
jgi:cytosine/adenosine deaminase-related metal-dependent hydrolase